MNHFFVSISFFSIFMATTSLPSDDDFDWSKYIRFDVKSKMVEHKITPTAVLVAPKSVCHIQFPWGEPEPGQVMLKASIRADQPNVTWDAKNESLYLMISFCVTNWFDVRDAPEQGRNYTLQEWTEWIIYNIPGQKISEGKPLYEYEPSPPSKDRNVNHLVVYLVYQQNGTMKIPATTEITWSEYEDRRTAAGFAKRYQLGNPVAGNFYYIKYDQQMEDESALGEEEEQDLTHENEDAEENDAE